MEKKSLGCSPDEPQHIKATSNGLTWMAEDETGTIVFKVDVWASFRLTPNLFMSKFSITGMWLNGKTNGENAAMPPPTAALTGTGTSGGIFALPG